MKKENLTFLVCPECRGKLKLSNDNNWLVCVECGRKYPIIEGIPILLPEKEAKNVLRNSTYYDNS